MVGEKWPKINKNECLWYILYSPGYVSFVSLGQSVMMLIRRSLWLPVGPKPPDNC